MQHLQFMCQGGILQYALKIPVEQFVMALPVAGSAGIFVLPADPAAWISHPGREIVFEVLETLISPVWILAEIMRDRFIVKHATGTQAAWRAHVHGHERQNAKSISPVHRSTYWAR